jgi:hypothetical protein
MALASPSYARPVSRSGLVAQGRCPLPGDEATPARGAGRILAAAHRHSRQQASAQTLEFTGFLLCVSSQETNETDKTPQLSGTGALNVWLAGEAPSFRRLQRLNDALAPVLRFIRSLCLCRPNLNHFVPFGANMTLKRSRGRLSSNYDEVTVHLLSAFFCITGQTAKDERLREAVETALVKLNDEEIVVTPSNVIKFYPRSARAS